MSLKRQLHLLIFIPILTGLCFFLLSIWQVHETRDTYIKGKLLHNVIHSSHVLTVLTQDILLYPTEKRPQQQWQKKKRELNDSLQKIDLKIPGAKLKVTHMRQDSAKLSQLFSDLIIFSKLLYQQTIPDPILIERRNRLVGSMSLTTYGILSAANSLATEMQGEQKRQRDLIIRSIIIITFVFLVLVILMVFWLRKNILGPLRTVQKGVQIVTSGKLDYNIGLDTQDELGQFSRAFDAMLANLRKTMTSRDELEDIVKHRTESLRKSRMAAISVMQDTEMQKKKAETALVKLQVAMNETRRLHHQIEFILGATKTGMSIFDTDLKLRYVDPEWQKIYGSPAEKNYSEYFLGCSKLPSDFPAMQAFADKKMVVYERTLAQENNRPVLVTALPYQDENEEWLVAEINVDITGRKQMEDDLKNAKDAALAEVKMLRGILPICSYCKKVRDDKGDWEQVDIYIHKHSDADISHSVCPECLKKHYPEEYATMSPKKD